MENFNSQLPEILILLFIAITFLQSGFDKLLDWKGNVGWLTGHFKETFMAGMVPLMVGVVMLLEIITGLLSVVGIYFLRIQNNPQYAIYAAGMAGLTLLLLLFGQRMSKDYPGAFTLTGYFLIVVFGLYLFNL